MSATKDKILDLAEAFVRQGGYHAFSFRQIADELAIKSASVHYHFPSKEELGSAVAERYAERFFGALGDAETAKDPIGHYVAVFEGALKNDGRMCLCGVLAAESGRLPEAMQTLVREFADKNVDWLTTAIRRDHSEWSAAKLRAQALLVFSAMEGAMCFASLSGDDARLRSVGRSLKAML